MNYRLHPFTRPSDMVDSSTDASKERSLMTRLSSSLDLIKRHHTQKSEQRYDNRLLRFYKNQHIIQELQEAGLTNFDLHRKVSRHIIEYLHKYEHAKAAIRGKLLDDGWGLLVATNLRIIYLHQIPLFTTMDEVSYDLVSGITCNQVGNLYASVTLHTRTKDYELQFVNLRAANKFVDFIEKMAVDREVMKEDVAHQMNQVHTLRGL